MYKAGIYPVFPTEQAEVNALEGKALLQLYRERWGHQDKRHGRQMLINEFDVRVYGTL